MPGHNGVVTKKRILDACEEVYAAEGIEGITLRMITDRAGVNLAGVNYHFRTKAILISAMLSRHLIVLHADRLSLLSLINTALGDRVRPTHLITALFLPTIGAMTDPDISPHFESFALRCASDPSSQVRKPMEEAFSNISLQVDAALAASAKHMSSEEVQWRAKVFFNNFAGTVINQNTLSMLFAMLRERDANVFNIIVQFGSVMECVMHRAADRQELHDFTSEALDILKNTASFHKVSHQMAMFPRLPVPSFFPA